MERSGESSGVGLKSWDGLGTLGRGSRGVNIHDDVGFDQERQQVGLPGPLVLRTSHRPDFKFGVV